MCKIVLEPAEVELVLSTLGKAVSLMLAVLRKAHAQSPNFSFLLVAKVFRIEFF